VTVVAVELVKRGAKVFVKKRSGCVYFGNQRRYRSGPTWYGMPGTNKRYSIENTEDVT
jgi:hypothetical protein